MGVLRLAGFSGMWPIRDPRALPDNAAVEATNIRSDGGAYLRGVSGLTLIKSLIWSTQMVYRIRLPGANTLANSYWMEFPDINTDVLAAPIVNDSFKRIYWVSPSTGLKYLPESEIIAGTPGLAVGTLIPTGAPLVEFIAGTGELDPDTGLNVAPKSTRSYLYTYINVYGEESQPGPSVEATGYVDGDWLVSGILRPTNAADRAAVSKVRIYRTVTGASGSTVFSKVVDLDVNDLANIDGTNRIFYMDRLSDSTVSAGTQLESTIWAFPPAGLQGLVAMPNGIFVSWKGKDLYFSENYRPHAWPAEYVLTVDFNIVGLGVFGNSLVVVTEGTPYVVSGVKSSTMASQKIDAPLPGLSRRSIVSAPEGVYFATEVGLALIGPQGTMIVTKDLISREMWRDEYKPENIRAAMVAGVYNGLRDNGVNDGFKFIPTNPQAGGISYIDLPVFGAAVANIGVEPLTGKPWVIANNSLWEYEKPGVAPLSYLWRSKEITYPRPANWKVYQIYFDDSTSSPLHFKAWATIRGANKAVTRVLVYDQDVPYSGSEVKFPSGIKADIWEFELSGTAEVQSFHISTSVEELRSG